MKEQSKAIIEAARMHISGCEGTAEPSDAYEGWNISDLPKVRGATSEEIRDRLSAEIKLQLESK